jgi:hypothetical protein
MFFHKKRLKFHSSAVKLTPWSTVLLRGWQSLSWSVAPTWYGNRQFITVFTKAHGCALTSLFWKQLTISHSFCKIHFICILPNTPSCPKKISSLQIVKLKWCMLFLSPCSYRPPWIDHLTIHTKRRQNVTLSYNYRVQKGSGAHPASYPMGTMGSFYGSKADGAWSWPLISI